MALMIRPTVEAVLSAPPERWSPEMPITAQVVKYPGARALALGRGLKNRMVRRSKGGAIEPQMARTIGLEEGVTHEYAARRGPVNVAKNRLSQVLDIQNGS